MKLKAGDYVVRLTKVRNSWWSHRMRHDRGLPPDHPVQILQTNPLGEVFFEDLGWWDECYFSLAPPSHNKPISDYS